MPDTFQSPLVNAQMPGGQSLEDRVKALEALVARSQSTDVGFASMDEAATDLGSYQFGQFIAGTGTPQGGDLTGTAMIWPGLVIGGITFTLVGMNNGNLEFGLSALDGTAVFAAGAGIINSTGIVMTGLYYPVQFTATNAGNTRTGRFGMTLLAGSSVPNTQWDYESPPGASQVLNGDAETGTTANWTDSATAWSAFTTNPFAGTYSFRHDPTNTGCPAQLTQIITGLSAGTLYSVGFASMRQQGYLTPRVFYVWRDSLHTVLRTDIVVGNSGGTWSITSKNLTSPTSTAEVVIELDYGDPFQDYRYDAITFGIAGVVLTQTATDYGFQFDGGPVVLQNQSAVPLSPPSGYTSIYSEKGKFFSIDHIGVLEPIGETRPYTMLSYTADLMGPTANLENLFAASIINSGTVAKKASIANHPGIWEFSSAAGVANSGGNVAITAGVIDPLIGGEIFEVIFNFPSLTSIIARLGLHNQATPTIAVTQGIWLDLAANVFTGKSVNGGVTTSTGTTFTISAATWYHLRIITNSNVTRADFYLFDSNENQLWTDNVTTNLPTGAVEPIAGAWKTTTGVVAFYDVDWITYYNPSILTR